jgi:predicted glutamine amidotransferase
MCVILHRFAGNFVDENDIIEAYSYNPHGCGLMYRQGNKVITQKGLWSLDYLLDKLESLGDIEYLLHLRIMTVGEINAKNCHPFKVKKNTWMMHNGTFNITQVNPNMSDTWHVAQMLRTCNLTNKFLNKFATNIGTNKVAFMNGKAVKKLGKWEYLDGNQWSNLYWVGGSIYDKNYTYDNYDDYYVKYHDYKEIFDEYVSDF